MKKYFFLLIFIFPNFVFSQKVEKLPLQKYKVAVLSDSLSETSGITFFQDKLYTFNDGGNPAEFYEISPQTGKIIQHYSTHFVNKDWEAIAQDGQYLYLGDFGNNAGKRKDLSIYQIDLLHPEHFQKFEFEYQDQSQFSPPYLKHDFDAEALIFFEGKLHIFTKKWASNSVSRYSLNVQNHQKQSLKNEETYPTGFVVTDASFFRGILYVVGYTKKGQVYMMCFEKDAEGNFLKKPLRKLKLGNATRIGQVEGIAVNEKGIYITCERFSKWFINCQQHLYFVPFKSLYP